MSRMKNALLLLVGILAVTSVCAAELHAKPTREQVIEFLDEWRSRPFTEEEEKIKWDEREKVNLSERFGTDFSGLDLSKIDFRIKDRGRVLSNIDFSFCNMRGVALSWSELVNCNFANADLTDVDFYYCELANSNFAHARLDRTQFRCSNMQNVFLPISTSRRVLLNLLIFQKQN
jgi:uncharacterized protein YjbI with pentapeptide repeats